MPATSMEQVSEQAARSAMHRERGMTAVIDAYQAPLLRYASRLLNNATAGQDVVQNALIKLFRQWQPGMQPDDAHLRNWLFRVTHNEAVDWIRAEARRRRLHDEHAAVTEVETGGVQADPPADERTDTVLQCLDALEPLQRQVILLRLQQGLSYAEIGAVTGWSVGYVGNLLHLAVKRLAAEVKQREGAAP